MGLQCSDLSKTFDDFTVKTNIHADNGELVTLLGPSGCGKTTTLQLIAGILNPDNGRIFLQGKDISSIVPWKRDIGIVFQDYALFPHLSVSGNIGYGLKYRKLSRTEIKDTVSRYLDLVHLQGYENRKIESLSGGEKQRVALARALAPSPRLLLLDEPLSALDSGLRKKLRREIRRIQQHLFITTIYVTHDQEEALTISDKIIIMNNGKIEQAGKPREIYNHPATKFSADFLGPSNLLPGIVTGVSKETGITVYSEEAGTPLLVPFQEKVSINDRVWIFFRSRYTHFFPSDSPETNKKNTFPGVITYHEYYGTYSLYEISVHGITLQAEQQGEEIIAGQQRQNEKVSVHILPEHCHLIKKQS